MTREIYKNVTFAREYAQETNTSRHKRLLDAFDSKLDKYLSRLRQSNNSSEELNTCINAYEKEAQALRKMVADTNIKRPRIIAPELGETLSETLSSERQEFAIEILARACIHFDGPENIENMKQLANLSEKLKQKFQDNGPDYTLAWAAGLCSFIALAAAVVIGIAFPPAIPFLIIGNILTQPISLVSYVAFKDRASKRHAGHEAELKAVNKTIDIIAGEKSRPFL